jgi:cell division protein FtsB
MKKFIVKKEQLVEYVEKKKAEKTFYDILEQLHLSTKMLNENVSHLKVNQSIIDNYRRKDLITPMVYEMLVTYKVINENYEIL